MTNAAAPSRAERFSRALGMVPHELDRNLALFQVLLRRSLWFIGVRWCVPPVMAAGALAGRALGFEFAFAGVLWVALSVALYNLVLSLLRPRVAAGSPSFVAAFTHVQVGLDYLAIFALIHFAGGFSSPVSVFLIFHIVIAAVLLPLISAWIYSAVAVAGLGCIALANHLWDTQHVLRFRSTAFPAASEPLMTLVELLFFATAAFATAYLSTTILRMLRRSMLGLIESQAAIERANDERDRFMLKVTHNMRAPLAASMSLLELVTAGYLGPVDDKQREHLQRVDRRLGGLLDTLSELLAIARRRHDAHAPQHLAVDLTELARRIHQTFAERALQKGLTFTLDCPEDEPMILLGDEKLLGEALENLVGNALKYTPRGHVTVTLARAEPWLMFRVEDTGIGIPHDDMGHLFSEFYRGANARSLDSGGTGLGLALVRQTIEQHGGTVEVRSQESFGSTFTVWLPVNESDTVEAGAAGKPAALAPARRPSELGS